MFLAYNKLLFNDNPSSLSYFYKNKDNAIDVVFDLNYEKNDQLIRRAIDYACQNGYIANDVKNVLFYNNPSRGYRKKLITMFISKLHQTKVVWRLLKTLFMPTTSIISKSTWSRK